MGHAVISPIELVGFLSPDECRRVISEAVVGDCSTGALVDGKMQLATRRANTYWLDEASASSWIFDRMFQAVVDCNRQHFGFEIEEFAERMQVSHYTAKHNGFFDWHIDIGNGRLAVKRKLTAVVQLSDTSAYDGGCLEANSNGSIKSASKQIGTIFILPSFVLHRVSPVLQGERFSLTLWSHGPAFR